MEISAHFPVGAVVAAQLYRIAQGAVHNAVEHGGTRKVEIDVAFDQGNLVPTIRDNRKGFDTSAISKGMGLRIMRYRAQSVGGPCEVQSNRTKARLSPAIVPSIAHGNDRVVAIGRRSGRDALQDRLLSWKTVHYHCRRESRSLPHRLNLI